MWTPHMAISDIAKVFHMSEEAADFAHRRVLRAVNRGAIGKPHDRRIAASATKRIEEPVSQLSAQLGLA